MVKTITLEDDTWEKLSMIKLTGKYKTLSIALDDLMAIYDDHKPLI